MEKKHFKIYITAIALLLISGGFFALWYRGGSELHTAYVDVNTQQQYSYAPRLFYRGLKIPVPGGSFVLFKRYYSLVEIDPYTNRMFSAAYEGDGYNDFYIFYDTGGIAAQGQCLVKAQEDMNGQILHSDIKDATFYDPDGSVVSEIKDGTGVEMLFFSDGTKQYELELENHQRKRMKLWLEDGTLKLDEIYSDLELKE